MRYSELNGIKLKPCPFCGRLPYYTNFYETEDGYIKISHRLGCADDGISKKLSVYYWFNPKTNQVETIGKERNSINNLLDWWNNRKDEIDMNSYTRLP